MPGLSFAAVIEEEPLNFMPSKLHFLDGVFITAGADVYPCESPCDICGDGDDGFGTLGTTAASNGMERFESTLSACVDSSVGASSVGKEGAVED